MDDYDGGDRHRLKNPFDLRELQENGCCTFELENNGSNLLDDDENDNVNHVEEEIANKKEFFKDMSLKNIEVLSRSAQNVMKDFDELESTMERIHEGIQKKVTRPGRGGKIPPGSKVWIHYSAFLEYADEPFDSSVHNSRPCYFKLGQGGTLPGLDIAVSTMEVREIADFLLQPDQAYGQLGCEPRIPRNSRVLFTIELLETQAVSKYAEIFEMSVEDRSELPFEEIFKAAEELKKMGKDEYSMGQYSEAVVMYSRAAKMLEQYFMTTPEDEGRKNLTLYSVFNNLAICYLKLHKPYKTINASKSAMNLPVDLMKDKAYYLSAKAYMKLGKMEQAESMINEARRICPNNPEIATLYAEIKERLHKDSLEQKDLFKKMMTLNVNR